MDTYVRRKKVRFWRQPRGSVCAVGNTDGHPKVGILRRLVRDRPKKFTYVHTEFHNSANLPVVSEGRRKDQDARWITSTHPFSRTSQEPSSPFLQELSQMIPCGSLIALIDPYSAFLKTFPKTCRNFDMAEGVNCVRKRRHVLEPPPRLLCEG